MSESPNSLASVEQVEAFIASEEHEVEVVGVKAADLEDEASSGSSDEETFTPKPTLPNELVDQILAELAKPELASCCRVNRVFLNLARPHLYRVVEFKCLAVTSLGVKRLVTTPGSDGIYRLLHNRPQLASLVRSVAVELKVCPPETAFEVWEAVYPTSSPKLGHNDISLNGVLDLWLKAHELDVRLLLTYLPKLQAASILDDEPWDAAEGRSHGPLWKQPVYLPSLTSLRVSEFDPTILWLFPIPPIPRMYLQLPSCQGYCHGSFQTR